VQLPRVTVCLSVDFDAVSVWMAWGARGVRALSRGEYGATVGAPRLLETLAKFGIPSTWFVPGHTADTFPEITARVADAGHEIGNHGYLHEDFSALPIDSVRAVIRKANDALRRVTGQQPLGIRTPLGDFDGSLFEVFLEEGFSYDSSIFGDASPRWCRGADTLRTDGPNTPGPVLDLVELPLASQLTDFRYLEYNLSPVTLRGLTDPADLLEIWKDEFDYAYAGGGGRFLHLVVHPQTIGWGLRLRMLEAFLEHCRARSDIRFETCRGVANEYRQVAQISGDRANADG
jgi:peptidoglycan-N-acetylglucosamine deacetylase